MAEHSRGTTPVAEAAPPALSHGVLGWLRANLFNSWRNAIVTILIVWVLIEIVPPLLGWILFGAVWGEATPQTCRAADGACWAFIHEKFRLIVFGLYPADEQWRPFLATVLLLAMVGASAFPRTRGKALLGLWVAAFLVIAVLMRGGVLGLQPVDNTRWGGLPLTLGLTVIGLGVAFPLSILLALGRRSRMPAIRTLSVVYIELIRGVPLITVLFMASFLFPLFLPAGMSVDNLLRAQVGMILFAAAYLAEAIRGGLQAIPKGQFEAADSLGLTYWQSMRKIILPQALRISIPAIVNTAISFLKDTSLVTIIGLFDLLGTAKAASTDPQWQGFYKEAYLFVALIYFVFCFSMSQYSQNLEARLSTGHRR